MSDADSTYWNDRYLHSHTGWDLGQVSPPLKAYFDQLTDKDKTSSILIPGCGNSYEAEYLLKKGFTDITLLDISPVLIDRLREKFPQAEAPAQAEAPVQAEAPTQTEAPVQAEAPSQAEAPAQTEAAAPTLRLITADFFDHDGKYDLIVEQTFFCALDPAKRPDYVEKSYSLLRPGGRLAGLLFDRDFPDGPPFGGHQGDYQKLLEKRFRLKTLAPCYNSIKPRAGTELFLIAEKC
jgi:methyl halide transferase